MLQLGCSSLASLPSPLSHSHVKMWAFRRLKDAASRAPVARILAGSSPAPAGFQAASSIAPRLAVRASTTYSVGDATNIKWHEGSVSRETRQELLGQKGCVLWFTGLSGSGKSTVAYTLEHALANAGKKAMVLDGDNIRHGLNSNLGFSAEDRKENIRRIGEVSKLFCEAGIITLVSFISPYKADRDAVRARVGEGDFLEVYMKIPLEVCESRDPKGLYKAARAGKIKGFTGIDDPYEAPDAAEIVMEVATGEGDGMKPPAEMAAGILETLRSKGYLTNP